MKFNSISLQLHNSSGKYLLVVRLQQSTSMHYTARAEILILGFNYNQIYCYIPISVSILHVLWQHNLNWVIPHLLCSYNLRKQGLQDFTCIYAKYSHKEYDGSSYKFQNMNIYPDLLYSCTSPSTAKHQQDAQLGGNWNESSTPAVFLTK